MRTIDAGLSTHVGLSQTTLAYLVTIAPRTTAIPTVRLTTAGGDLTVGGNDYDGNPGIIVGNITHEVGEATSVDLDIPVDGTSPITRADLRSGLYDNATVTIDLVNYENPAAGTMRIASGRIGTVNYHDGGGAKIEFRGLWSLSKPLRLWTYGPTCRDRLGGTWCAVPIKPDDVARSTAYAADDYVRVDDGGYQNRMFKCTTAGTTAGAAPSYDFTVGATTTDGTAVFTAEEAWIRQATVATVTTNRKFTITVTESRAVADWFTDGALIFTSGSNNGIAYDIRKHTAGANTIELWVNARGTVAVGDTLEIHPGCDKTIDGTNGCATKFDNVEKFQGFPHLPGEDFQFGGYYATSV